MNTHLLEVFNLHVDDAVGQTELRDAVFQHTTNLMKGFEHIYIVAELGHVAGKT